MQETFVAKPALWVLFVVAALGLLVLGIVVALLFDHLASPMK
jgi:hypothetical protein